MNTQSLTNSRARTLFIAGGAFVFVFILWQWTSQSPILYPLRLFVTFVHEAGHGLTAILTGGRFERFIVFPNGAGLAYTAGGSPFFVLQMGYLGAALFGAILMYATNRAKDVRWVAIVVGLFFAICALLFTGNGQSAFLLCDASQPEFFESSRFNLAGMVPQLGRAYLSARRRAGRLFAQTIRLREISRLVPLLHPRHFSRRRAARAGRKLGRIGRGLSGRLGQAGKARAWR